MQRTFPLSLFMLLLLCGCGTSVTNTESTRGIVLQYLGGDVGTAGPFGKGGKKELDVLSESDRRQAEALIDRGAVLFLIFGTNAAAPVEGSTGGANRVVLVQNGQIVGDFRAVQKPQG